jgi:hypothetical protein
MEYYGVIGVAGFDEWFLFIHVVCPVTLFPFFPPRSGRQISSSSEVCKQRFTVFHHLISSIYFHHFSFAP